MSQLELRAKLPLMSQRERLRHESAEAKLHLEWRSQELALRQDQLELAFAHVMVEESVASLVLVVAPRVEKVAERSVVPVESQLVVAL